MIGVHKVRAMEHFILLIKNKSTGEVIGREIFETNEMLEINRRYLEKLVGDGFEVTIEKNDDGKNKKPYSETETH